MEKGKERKGKERKRRQDGRSSMGSGIFTAVMATTDMVMEGRVVVGDSETVAAGRMESDYGRVFWCCWCNLGGPTVVMRLLLLQTDTTKHIHGHLCHKVWDKTSGTAFRCW